MGVAPINFNGLAQHRKAGLVEISHRDPVALLNPAAGMHQAVGQGAVIGHEQQPFRIEIQPPHGIDPLAAVRHQLGDILSSLLIGKRGHISAGLMEHEIALGRRLGDGMAVQRNLIFFCVGGIAQVRRHAVDRHPSRGNHGFCLPAGGNPVAGEYFLNSFLQGYASLTVSFHTSGTRSTAAPSTST